MKAKLRESSRHPKRLGATVRTRRLKGRATLLGVGLVISVLCGIGLGAVPIAPQQILAVIGHELFGVPGTGLSAADIAIVWQVRVPRVLLGGLVGAGLAVCGVALQAMVRNLLADPYLLGINSGASTGAAAAILFGFGAGFGAHALQISAFLGALAASMLVYGIARGGGRVTSVRLILAGVAVGYALFALTSFLVFASGSAEGARSVMFWLLGSLSLAEWGTPFIGVAAVTLLTVSVLAFNGRRLDVLALGDESALVLGVRPDRLRTGMLALVALCIGVLVSAAGSISFVGLVVPHLARRMFGPTHKRLVPAAAAMGGVLLIWADIAARTLLSPQEVPIGILTALVGAPFLLILIRQLRTAV